MAGETGRELLRGRIAVASCRARVCPAVDHPVEKRAGGEHDGAAGKLAPVGQVERNDPVVLAIERGCFGLDDGEALDLAQRGLHGLAIKPAVGLRARPAHRRALRAVEHAELDAGGIGDATH